MLLIWLSKFAMQAVALHDVFLHLLLHAAHPRNVHKQHSSIEYRFRVHSLGSNVVNTTTCSGQLLGTPLGTADLARSTAHNTQHLTPRQHHHYVMYREAYLSGASMTRKSNITIHVGVWHTDQVLVTFCNWV